MTNELFIQSPTKALYEKNKQDIHEDAIVFIEELGEESIIAKGKTYQAVPSNGEEGQVLTTEDNKVKWTTLPTITIDSELSDTSENAVQNKVVKSALDNLKTDVTQSIDTFFDNSDYDNVTRKLRFFHKEQLMATVDATPFIVDNFVDTVKIENGNIVITFNAEDKEPIKVPIVDIFNADNYYTKAQSDATYVTLGTAQTITGTKTFNNPLSSGKIPVAIFGSPSQTPFVTFINGTNKSGGVGYVGNYMSIIGYGGQRIVVTDDGLPQYMTAHNENAQTLLHAGNYASLLDNTYVKKSGDTMSGELVFSDGNIEGAYIAQNASKGGLMVCLTKAGTTDANWKSNQLLINKDGNVTIGDFNKVGGNHKLFIDGTLGISSTTKVDNLNADMINSYYLNNNEGNLYKRSYNVSSPIQVGNFAYVKITLPAYRNYTNRFMLRCSGPNATTIVHLCTDYNLNWYLHNAGFNSQSRLEGIYYANGTSGKHELYLKFRAVLNSLEIQSNIGDLVVETGDYSAETYTAITTEPIQSSMLTANAATKLSTPRTLWGQSFDGSGNVSGDMSGVGSITASGSMTITKENDNYFLVINSAYEMRFGIGSGGVNRGLYDATKGSWLIYRDATDNVLIPNGNVGIGTTAPTEKLHVVGNIKATGRVIAPKAVSKLTTSGAITLNASIHDVHIITLNGNVSNLTLSSMPEVGQQVDCLLYGNGTERTVTVVNSGIYKTNTGENLELTVPANGYAEVNFLYDGTNVWVRGA